MVEVVFAMLLAACRDCISLQNSDKTGYKGWTNPDASLRLCMMEKKCVMHMTSSMSCPSSGAMNCELLCCCAVPSAPSPAKPTFNAFHLPVSRALLVTVIFALMGIPLLLFMGGYLQVLNFLPSPCMTFKKLPADDAASEDVAQQLLDFFRVSFQRDVRCHWFA